MTEDAICGDLCDLCRGAVAGRASADEVTLFKSVGTALEDLAAAVLAYAYEGGSDRPKTHA
jgi:ornithine cyclodeaminase